MPDANAKSVVRAQARELVARLTVDARERASIEICRRVTLLLSGTSGVVAAFWPLDSEPDIRGAIRPLAAEGRLAIPRFDEAAKSIELALVRDTERELVADRRRVFQPGASCPRVEVGEARILLVPGLAFDGRGNRLGRGGGFYDRLLAPLRDLAVGPRVVGVCFACQRLGAVPVDEHDCPVDMLVSEAGATDCRGSRASP